MADEKKTAKKGKGQGGDSHYGHRQVKQMGASEMKDSRQPPTAKARARRQARKRLKRAWRTETGGQTPLRAWAAQKAAEGSERASAWCKHKGIG